ncbi:hypothetical protein D7Y27_34065 [Corallococcus sp. AB004]|uniref:hypothetical protein n=1 Tax=Corallococcus exiguus TaxID=83462 RepID=UPI000EA2D5CF|nr:hypothetical protein [Corallococcus exiguus]NPD28880.1 hypothetical protein [Corallococcus exiguus]RKI33971.1 hypothetical protein D7Y27_34065 [Corallococcus sp. AB004]
MKASGFVVVVAVVLAWTGVARAEPRPAQLLIWGGGKDTAEAEASLGRWQERAKKNEWDGTLKVAEGYPRIVQSDTVPGLKPGFVVVVLGACEPTAAPKVMETLKAFEPAVYVRDVTWAEPLACPQLGPEWRVVQSKSWKKKDNTLTAVLLQTPETKDPSKSTRQALRVMLRAPDGRLLGLDERSGYPGVDDFTGKEGFVPTLDGAGPTVTYLTIGGGCTGGPNVYETRVKYASDGDTLSPQVRERTLLDNSNTCDR